MEGVIRNEIKPGMMVAVVKKEHQRTNELTQGIVRDILTNTSEHPRGIKVRLTSGEVGRVQMILE